jgi:hypothetical protein
MTDPKDRAAPEFDRDIDTTSVVSFGIGLALVMTIVLALVWFLVSFWKERQIARDPAPSPIAQANEPRLPPEPRLQSAPGRDMQELRAQETATLSSYGWVDRQAGIARIPIDRAIDLVLEKGLPVAAPETAAPKRRTPRRPRRVR